MWENDWREPGWVIGLSGDFGYGTNSVSMQRSYEIDGEIQLKLIVGYVTSIEVRTPCVFVDITQ